MRAIILVGGFGTRMRPLTYTTPKSMLPIAGAPQIERKIAHLVSHGVDDIILSLGFKPDAFQRAYPDNHCAGAVLHYVVESEPLGTAGAVAFAAAECGVDGTFLAMNGDTLTDLDVTGLVALHKSHGAEGTLALTPVDDPSRFGVVPTDSESRVLAFIEKPARDEAPTNLINAGTYVLEPEFLRRIPAGREVSIERETFPAVVDEGKLFAAHMDRYWLDIGTPEAYLQGNLDVLDQHYEGDSYFGEEAQIAAGATVKRSVIDAGAIVDVDATVRESVLMPGARVGAGAIVERSVVGENAHVGSGAQLTNLSVVGGGLEVVPDSRLDGEKVDPPGV